jgi:DNA-binding LytR/AlgR family response regulator
MINFVVVEDNSSHRKYNVNMITNYMMSNKLEFKIHEYNNYSKKLLNDIKGFGDNSVYIIDLELPSGDGLDIVRVIRNEYNNWVSPIIIITAHASLYYNVYKERLQILDFISKCEDIKKNLSLSIDICLRMFSKEKVYRYTYKNVDYAIRINKICYIQRDGRKTKIVTTDDTYYQNISINEIKEKLPETFIVSSKGTLINMSNVDKIDWNECLVYFKHGIMATALI